MQLKVLSRILHPLKKLPKQWNFHVCLFLSFDTPKIRFILNTHFSSGKDLIVKITAFWSEAYLQWLEFKGFQNISNVYKKIIEIIWNNMKRQASPPSLCVDQSGRHISPRSCPAMAPPTFASNSFLLNWRKKRRIADSRRYLKVFACKNSRKGWVGLYYLDKALI